MSRFPITAILAALSIGFALTLAIPLGIVAAVRQNSWVDRLALFLTVRSEEHTSELQSLMRISYAVFCLKKKTPHVHTTKFVLPSSVADNPCTKPNTSQ